MQDPFGECRGIMDYATLLKRLQKLKEVLQITTCESNEKQEDSIASDTDSDDTDTNTSQNFQ